MSRKLTALLLTGMFCLFAVTGALAQQKAVPYNLDEYESMMGKKLSFKEAPMLKAMVASGELPPLSERLPEDVLVIQPAQEIGQYGGTWRQALVSAVADYADRYGWEYLAAYTPDMNELFPNLLKGWDVSADGSIFTLYMRQGVRWSDGVPFTADDLLFYWHDIALNEELSPSPPARMIRAGAPGTMNKIDDYTVEITFAEPYGVFIETLARWRPNPYAPKHYLRDFHAKYAPKAELDEKIKAEGLDTWAALFQAKKGGSSEFWAMPERPVIGAWLAKNSITDPIHVLERNPYYYKVDTEGNQLPYIDRLERTTVTDRETALLKLFAGDVDFLNLQPYGVDSFSLAVDYQDQGDYRLVRFIWPPESRGNVGFNMSHKDPILKDLFNNKSFRIALSIAINREEINALLYQGLADVSNASLMEGPPFHGENLFKQNLEYNPREAARILDELGLAERDEEGYRLRSDGDRLRLSMIIPNWYPKEVEIAEMVKDYWKEAGIQLATKPISGRQLVPMWKSGDFDVDMVAMTRGGRPINPLFYADFVPISSWYVPNPAWSQWFRTQGEEGDEPPADLQRVMALRERALGEPDEATRIALTLEMAKLMEDNFWVFSALQRPNATQFAAVNKAIMNLPEPHIAELIHEIPSQFFFKR
jgi:peptide/nickel transport system substrate-binding protein